MLQALTNLGNQVSQFATTHPVEFVIGCFIVCGFLALAGMTKTK